ncbi:MAG: hypothetical protein ACK5PS_11675 [Desulfopila sp.]
MQTINTLLLYLDPWFIAPYRWLTPASAGYVLGTVLLALQCVVLGDLAATLVMYLNSKHLSRLQRVMDRNHRLAEEALKQGDKASYKAVNRQAMDAFGHSFSLGAALFCVSIWPMPFALAWLSNRFTGAPLELPIALPFAGTTIDYFPSFLLIYIVTRLLYSRLISRWPWYAQCKARLVGRAE